MRVTFNAVRDGLAEIQNASDQFASAQWEVSSGKRVRVPSDDPFSAQAAINDTAELSSIDGYTQAANASSSRLSMLDTTLGDMVSKLTQALSSAQGAHGDTASAATQTAAAQELLGIRDSLAADVNTKFNGTYIFGGSKTTTAPYAQVAGAWTYQGDATPVTVAVDTGSTVSITMNGQSIMQGGDATDVLSELDTLVTAVQANDQVGIGNGIDALNRAFNRTVRAQTLVGTDETSVADIQLNLTSRQTSATARLSKDQDANMADAITRMNQAQVAYQSALGAVSTANKTSLLDYLK
jgi:flagellar hook-associated protein 3 FlgL